MAFLDGLEAVIRENRRHGVEKLSEAILGWAKKKKMSVQDLGRLRSQYIASRWPESEDNLPSERRSLPKRSSTTTIALSLARLALDDDKEDADIDRSDLEICEYEPVSKSWLMHELRGQRDMHVRDMERLLENHQEKIMMRFESMFGEVCARLEKAELAVDTLTTKTQQQADQIAALEKRLAALEDSEEQNEQRRRALNLVVEGLNVENKTKEESMACVQELLTTKLGVSCKASDVIRIRSAAEQRTKLIVRFNNQADKQTTLANCRKLKNHPGVKIWEDLTPRQQAKKKQQMPRFRELRQEGKIAYFRGDKLFVRDHTGAQPRLVAVVRN